MERLIHKVINWAEESNIVNGSDLKTETLKLVAEFGEMACSINRVKECRKIIGNLMIIMIIICRMKNISLYDCLEFTQEITEKRVTNRRFVLKIMTQHLGKLTHNIIMNEDIGTNMGYLLIYLTALTKILRYSLRDCLEIAYNDIAFQRGVMFDGTFINETDEKYDTAVAILKSQKPDE
ncbi:hypothetical protein [Nitrosomonas sp. Nm166]|uniref:hypothetical protein n=1 Tax=Nitrosomonas sp. Nm166 TaxID=1881054 RepID=UPI0008DF854E|nr:hypothetical protein [Nitrosomonas sp. Nm166]SFF16586.1 hypothetical protein SAMN05428977_10615 [Nitrosomonas sp. Nm166]